MTRALATLDTIRHVTPIPGADRIETARVRGWDVVVKRGQFTPGSRCVYLEIDSMLDVTDPRYAHLAKHGTRTDTDGNTGHVLRTMKFRGQLSQGMVLSLDEAGLWGDADLLPDGHDLTDHCGVRLWVAPIPADLTGQVYGELPSWIERTDEDRVQNLADLHIGDPEQWVATEKLDGTSMTVAIQEGVDDFPKYRVCGRGLDLVKVPTNTLWHVAIRDDLHAFVARQATASHARRHIAVQGELVGPGIQGNPYQLPTHQFYVFTVTVDGRRVPRSEWDPGLRALSVPVLNITIPPTIEGILEQVDRRESVLTPGVPAEGVVWRTVDQTRSFKAINNTRLLEEK